MIAAKLAHVEWLKLKARFAFWVATLSFAALLLISLGASHYANQRLGAAYTYRPVWPAALNGAEGFGLLIMMVLIVLLTASEKTWRTERQNVIDGLSRTQYFAGKVILLVGATLVMWLTIVVLGGVFEVLNRSLVDGVQQPFIGDRHLLLLVVMLLYLFLVGAVALMFGAVAPSSGAALALAFLFLLLQAPIIMIMARQGGMWQEATAYMPMNVLQSLTSTLAWDADAYRETTPMMRERGLPVMLSGGRAAVMAAIYSAMMCGVAFLSLRTRDL